MKKKPLTGTYSSLGLCHRIKKLNFVHCLWAYGFETSAETEKNRIDFRRHDVEKAYVEICKPFFIRRKLTLQHDSTFGICSAPANFYSHRQRCETMIFMCAQNGEFSIRVLCGNRSSSHEIYGFVDSTFCTGRSDTCIESNGIEKVPHQQQCIFA